MGHWIRLTAVAAGLAAACGDVKGTYIDANDDGVDAAGDVDAAPPDAAAPDAEVDAPPDAGGPFTTCELPSVPPRAVAIIESASGGHDMDVRWRAVAEAQGHTATILPQAALSSPEMLASADLVIVSSGVIALPDGAAATLAGVVASGRGVYLQGEYLPEFTTNRAFETIAAQFGATVTYTSSTVDYQDPVTAGGCWGTHPEELPAITRHWYGATATSSGPGLEVMMTSGAGVPIGFALCTQGATRGLIVQTTDQDFIRDGDTAPGSVPFMRNVLARLAFADRCVTPGGVE